MPIFSAWVPVLAKHLVLPKNHIHVWKASLISPALQSLADSYLVPDEKVRSNSISDLKVPVLHMLIVIYFMFCLTTLCRV